MYFDTPDLLSYRRPRCRRRRRFKVRMRSYLDSGLHFLEVKTRGPRGTTVKQRIPYTGDGEHLAPTGRAVAYADTRADRRQPPAFADASHRPDHPLPAHHPLPAADRSRVTIDTELTWTLPDGADPALAGCAIVETKCRPGRPDRPAALGVTAPPLPDLQVRHRSRRPASRSARQPLASRPPPPSDS